MTWDEFVAMPDSERAYAFQQLNPYDEPPIFEAVRLAFLAAHPQCGAPHEVSVGEIGTLGPLNGVGVKVAPGSSVRVPLRFMSLPVSKLIKAKNGGWKRAR